VSQLPASHHCEVLAPWQSRRRNFGCDDSVLTLRSNLIRDHGSACAVIAGDMHAFNAFILAGQHGHEVAFGEPQTDGLVTELTGQYSVDRRCEVLL
jgi:hypothetical protein